jgi:hypothetical protein
MGKFVIGALLGLVIGLAGGAFIGFSGGTGVGAGVGIATGFTAGACGVVRVAQEEGLLTEEQVDQVFNRGLEMLAEMNPDAPASEPVADSAAECDAALARLRQASAAN